MCLAHRNYRCVRDDVGPLSPKSACDAPIMNVIAAKENTGCQADDTQAGLEGCWLSVCTVQSHPGDCSHHPDVPHHPSRHHLLTYFSGVFGKRKSHHTESFSHPSLTPSGGASPVRLCVRKCEGRAFVRNGSVAFRNHQRRHHTTPLQSVHVRENHPRTMGLFAVICTDPALSRLFTDTSN